MFIHIKSEPIGDGEKISEHQPQNIIDSQPANDISIDCPEKILIDTVKELINLFCPFVECCARGPLGSEPTLFKNNKNIFLEGEK